MSIKVRPVQWPKSPTAESVVNRFLNLSDYPEYFLDPNNQFLHLDEVDELIEEANEVDPDDEYDTWCDLNPNS